VTEESTIHRIHSERYGELEVSEQQIFHFEQGLVGLQDIRRYALIGLDDTPFYIMHALDQQLSFILLPAEKAVSDYGFTIDQETVDLLGVSKPEEVAIMLIVNIVDDWVHVNLKAPLLFALERRTAVQYVVHDQNFPLRYPLPRKKKEA